MFAQIKQATVMIKELNEQSENPPAGLIHASRD